MQLRNRLSGDTSHYQQTARCPTLHLPMGGHQVTPPPSRFRQWASFIGVFFANRPYPFTDNSVSSPPPVLPRLKSPHPFFAFALLFSRIYSIALFFLPFSLCPLFCGCLLSFLPLSRKCWSVLFLTYRSVFPHTCNPRAMARLYQQITRRLHSSRSVGITR